MVHMHVEVHEVHEECFRKHELTVAQAVKIHWLPGGTLETATLRCTLRKKRSSMWAHDGTWSA